jgi:CheY-like chemotaxis protein
MPPATLICLACRRDFGITSYNPASRYPCPNCGGNLSLPERLGQAVRPAAVEAMPAEAVAAASQPGARLGRYILVNPLGAGSMGAVHRAWDDGLKRWVAVKLFTMKAPSLPDLARFRREAKVAAALEHPNIAAVYDVGESGGRHYIVMRLIEGRTLDQEFLRADGAHPDTRQVALALEQACRGVGHAHKLKIVHRDIKPSNIMREPSGHVFVLDFGLAKSLNAPGITIPGARALFGTPAYMPPEASGGSTREIDARSDVFSLGASLFTLLTGRHVWVGATPIEQLTKAIRGTPVPRLRSLRAEIPAAIDDVAARATAQLKADRFPDAAAMADALKNWLDSSATQAPPAGNRAVLVDDDPQVIHLLKRVCEQLGLAPESCAGVHEAISCLATGPAAVVILDLNLADGDGLQVLRALRAQPPHRDTPVVLITGADDEERAARGFELKADDYLAKPLRLVELRARLKRLIER